MSGTGTYLDRLDVDPDALVLARHLTIEPAGHEPLAPDETGPVPDVLPHDLVVVEVEVPLGLRPKPPVHGIAVDLEQHRQGFRRKWPDDKVAAVVPVPLVPCRDARPQEIPAEAARAAAAAVARGLEVRITYAQGGTMRRWRDRGRCRTCGATPMVMAEDKRDQEAGAVLQAHSRPRADRCPGSGQPSVFGRLCAKCSTRPKKMNKNGTVPSHQPPLVPCPDQRAAEMIPGDPREPLASIAVRVTGVAVACWLVEAGGKGKFEVGFTWNGTHLAKASATEFQRACSDGAGPARSPGRSGPATGDATPGSAP